MAAKDISLVGATFYAVPQVDLPISGGGTASFVEISDTTATAADVASGKYFYTAAGVKTEGTASGGGGDPWSWMGKNPTKVKDYGTSKVYLKDTGFNTWTPSTSASQIVAQADLETYTADFANYDYIVVFRFHTHFEYGSGRTAGNYITDYYWAAFNETLKYRNNYSSMVSGNYSTITSATVGGGSRSGLFYKAANGNDTYSYSNSYGVFPNSTPTPSLNYSTSALIPRSPRLNACCQNTYFSTTNAAAVDKTTSYYELSVQIWRVDNHTNDSQVLDDQLRDMWLNGIS